MEKATLLYVARLMRRKFSVIRISDREDPLRVLVKGEDVEHLRYELEGSESVLDQVRDKMGVNQGEEIVLSA